MAMRYPPEWIDELRARADIVAIVSEYVQLKQNGRRYWGLCPFHHEKTPSFSVDPAQGLYYCFGCKAGGSVIQFVMAQERLEFAEALRYLADKVRMPLPPQIDDPDAERRRSQRERILLVNREAALFYHEQLYAPEGAQALTYLHGRGLDDPAIRMFGLGASPAGWDVLTRTLLDKGHPKELLVQAGLTVDREGRLFDMFRGRAMFPIISAQGAVLGFGGRALQDVQPKYLNTADTPAFNKRLTVYAANLLRKARGLTRVLLVEGYMDVASLVARGVTGVVATLGTSLTPEQAKLLGRYAPEVWIAYDGDSAGQKAALRALDIFDSIDVPARVLAIPDGLDPDDFIRARGREAFEALTPLPAPLYRIRRAADGLDLATEEGRTRYAMAGAAILRGIAQPVERENLLKRLIVETGYSREVLLQQMGRAEPAKTAYTTGANREKLPKVDPLFLPDHLKAERVLLSLLATGQIDGETVTPDRFTEARHGRIAAALLAGQKPVALLEGAEDDQERALLAELFGAETHPGDAVMRVAAECLERMRRGVIDARIQTLTDSLPTAAGNDKWTIIKEIEALNKEKQRLRPGRKE
ncbi:MAG: DNA primase [Oscillospiraceae bacterium]|nr:DNA primase [Oscillospiraceae bacterium]